MTAHARENVAIFNPLVLPLPSWHPDGPDGKIDGYVIPFVFPDNRPSGRQPNRGARIRVAPTDHGWRANLLQCQDHAETPEQARAFAAAWIRAAEVLENVQPKPAAPEGDVVDAEVVEDDDDEDRRVALLRGRQRVRVLVGDEAGRCGEVVESRLSGDEPIQYDVLLEPDPERRRGFETLRFEHDDVEPVE